MLSQKHRLSRAQFGKVFNKSMLLHTEYFSIKWTDALSSKEPQFAVVVSKKVSRSAIKRNQIRRRCYEILQKLLPQMADGIAGIIFVRLGATPLLPQVLEEKLGKLLLRARIISKL